MFFVTAVFGLLASLILGAPWWAYLVGLWCIIVSHQTDQKSLLFFGLFACLATNAAIWVYTIGAVAIVADLVCLGFRLPPYEHI